MNQHPLNSDQLQAFEAVARLGNFTLAASELALTQPALSRRIQGLEEQLKATLFLRKPSGVELTQAGCRLLRFAEAKKLLELELKDDLSQGASTKPAGLVRIAGYTSILHEVVTPSIGKFLRGNPAVDIRYQATQDVNPRERQGDLLTRAETDLLLSVCDFASRDIESKLLGTQELIAVESTKYSSRTHVYLDTRPEDHTTREFFKVQSGTPPPYERSFLYDEDGILQAVTEGIGRAVVFRSLVKKGMPVRQVRGTKPLRWPVYLNYRRQPYYLPAVDGIRKAILVSARKYFS